MEIERKFLIKSIPENQKIEKSIRIEQYYICRDDNKIIRIRKIDDVFNIGIKQGGGMIRFEKEIEISKKDFEELKKLAPDNKIIKTRHIVRYNKYDIEIDEFDGNHKGLVIAEIEFSSESEAKQFNPPSWFGVEVTNNILYTNSNLSKTQLVP